MHNKVVLLDLENNVPTAQLFRDIIEHYRTLYIFNGLGQFQFPLADLTELAAWISSGQIVVLDTLTAKEKEFEYAVVVGQLLALIELETHIEVISAQDTAPILTDMISASGFQCSLIQIQAEQAQTQSKSKAKFSMPSTQALLANPQLLQIKKYCEISSKNSGKPNTVTKLKNALCNILQVDAEQATHLVGMLINLKIVKCQDDQVSFRKKVLKQWVELDLSEANTLPTATASQAILEKVDSILSTLNIDPQKILAEIEQQQSIESVQSDLFKNFDQIDPVQMEVIRKLNAMKSEKPKDIYALRDLLEELFPKSDVRLLLKEMIEKGYIYWNGHAVIYSHEMFLN